MQTLKIPFLVACSTVIAHVLWAAWRLAKRSKGKDARIPYSIIRANGGITRLIFRLGRVLGILTLLICSIISVRKHNPLNLSILFQFPEAFITYTYVSGLVYSFLLSVCALVSEYNHWRLLASKSVSIVLLSTWGVYAYRDLWPLATYTLQPQDGVEGNVLWFKISVLTVISVIMPLLIPRRYVPVDPKNPMPAPTTEQTASWLSLASFTFMDSLIALGSRVPHIPVDALPPLLDSDDSHYLIEKGFHHIDRFSGAPNRHLFWGLVRNFWRLLLIAFIADLISVISPLAYPVGLNKILHYLETHGEGETVRPWFWIIWLFLSPTVTAVASEITLYYSIQLNFKLKALVTELVFEHSLRVRLTADGRGASSDISDDADDKSKKNTRNLIGKINNAVTTDVGNVLDGTDFLSFGIVNPINLVICLVLLYQILGWSASVAVVLTLFQAPLSGYIGTFLQSYETTKMEKTDARVEKTSEAISVLRMVKLFGWEGKMKNLINETRRDELAWLKKLKILRQANVMFAACLPLLTQLATYATLTIALGDDLVPSKIFSSLVLFSLLKGQLQQLSWGYSGLITAKVSLDRINSLLHDTELLDSFAETEQRVHDEEDTRIGFKNANFAWSEKAAAGTDTSAAARSFTLQIRDEIIFKEGKLNLISGPTGCGKTSMLLALLGEMHYTPVSNASDSWYNLPRSKGVAYAAQESWVLNTTIRENILFGSSLDEERYQQVLFQCALKRDLELFEAGDNTEVGERGLTLSGGQKARLTLARAVYSSAQTILLDDIFAALDVHTSASIAKECFGGDLMRGRTVILITHNLPLVMPLAAFLVTMNSDGALVTEDIEPAPSQLDPVIEEMEKEIEEPTGGDDTKDAKPTSDGKLILAEEVAEGRITWKSIKLLVHGLGGKHLLFFVVVWFSLLGLHELLLLTQTWFLGYWGSQYSNAGDEPVSALHYVMIYGLIILVSLLVQGIQVYTFILGAIRASESIHTQLVDSVLSSTLRWLDETPTGRILARFTQDIQSVDGSLPFLLSYVVGQIVGMLSRFTSILIFTPAFLVPGIAVALSGMYLAKIYLKAQLSTKREMSNALSPMLAHFSASIHGLVSIRAYGAQAAFKEESLQRINHYIRISRPSYNLNRWLSIRIDILGALFTTGLATYLVYGASIGASDTGFILSVASSFTGSLYFLLRMFNNLQIQSNSLERIQGYLDIDHEPPATEAGKPPAAWPTSGDLRVENLSARYSKNGPLVLHNLSFHIQSGQRVGVVGRTGSGKSSLTLSLLRCIMTEGEMFYDGLATSRINLEALRSSITIIPQTPELLSGTLRQNLDPFGKEDDATLNDALRCAGLYALQEAAGDAKITLDSVISGGGSNLSVGQRQILALARAILRRSKLLILDEATSAIDYKTDTIIQNTLRTQLDPDVTVITVAHRLQTIMDSDKIMVLDAGKLMEFDTPANLLRQLNSTLKALVDKSHDSAILRTLAGQ
ncbi:hypothetical protein BJ165DRAFT_1604107 [Panaeolus papilionaceus]|nr:hypothetical protein BJ165DRAFT_1604107 [Panaeolus papilionaceus]